METGILLDTHSATLELVNACGALPEFDTLQIVHLLIGERILVHGPGSTGCDSVPCTDQQKKRLRKQVKSVKDLAIGLLKKAKARRLEGERRKMMMLRVIELRPYISPSGDHLDSVKVKAFGV